MNRIVLVALVFFSHSVLGQKKLTTENGQVNFISNAELELIKASSTAVRGIIDQATSQFAFTMDVRTFKGFNSELQREHFLEKYMEIHKFPKATYTGKIIEKINFDDSTPQEVRAKGTLSIHGQDQIRIIKCRVSIINGVTNVECKFNIPLSDHNIVIPSIVSRKIATEIDVTLKAALQ